MVIVALLVTFGIALCGNLWFISGNSPLRILDKPNERSLHTVPTPRSGGVAIVLGIMTGWLLLVTVFSVTNILLILLLVSAVIAAISFIDDLFELSALSRLIVQVCVAMLLMVAGFAPFATWWGWLVGILFVVWMINLYNFMDGMDGFAAGMGVLGFGFFALSGWLAHAPFFSFMSLTIVVASLGFLIINFPPARIFMGDCGSATMGLLLAFFSLWGMREGIFVWWVPILIFSPFIVDATVTLLRRLFNGEKVWQAHRTHFYQRMVQMGWGHRKTVLAEYLLMVLSGCSALAFSLLSKDGQLLGISMWIAIYIIIGLIICRMERRQEL